MCVGGAESVSANFKLCNLKIIQTIMAKLYDFFPENVCIRCCFLRDFSMATMFLSVLSRFRGVSKHNFQLYFIFGFENNFSPRTNFTNPEFYLNFYKSILETF